LIFIRENVIVGGERDNKKCVNKKKSIRGETMLEGLRFVPSRVEGLQEVSEVAVFPDRLEMCSAGKWLSFPFVAMAQNGSLVGERDWFHSPAERFFRFFTTPRIVLFLPDEPAETNYGNTWFWRVREVMGGGGFDTWDLG
jgi:hypothetical protein